MKCSGWACVRRKENAPLEGSERKSLRSWLLCRLGSAQLCQTPGLRSVGLVLLHHFVRYSPSFTRYLSNFQICLHFLPSYPCLRPCYITWLPPVHTLSSFFPNAPPHPISLYWYEIDYPPLSHTEPQVKAFAPRLGHVPKPFLAFKAAILSDFWCRIIFWLFFGESLFGILSPFTSFFHDLA